MSDVHFPLTADADFDDLPRTVRREKEARAREARAARERARRDHDEEARLEPTFGDLPSYLSRQRPSPPAYGDEPIAAAVQRFDVSFLHLVTFFFKAAIAAIPALIFLAAALYYIGKGVAIFYPDLATMKILIAFGS
ncbi:hypothetical protein [Hyphomicrobium sp. CS1GBMeth3]|uniref:hypothetical protein n=1 Tax=Hyphomicrobium sp. CS1GBMeth3 TaxID=1892845 RepID=UPI000931705B|nr:hypothetical protein [Hyphomicrobium sp. CS1GBMeth3]